MFSWVVRSSVNVMSVVVGFWRISISNCSGCLEISRSRYSILLLFSVLSLSSILLCMFSTTLWTALHQTPPRKPSYHIVYSVRGWYIYHLRLHCNDNIWDSTTDRKHWTVVFLWPGSNTWDVTDCTAMRSKDSDFSCDSCKKLPRWDKWFRML